MNDGRKVLVVIVVAFVLLAAFGFVFNHEIFNWWADQQG